jgi:CheY-like chemotaxis protein
MMPVMDGWEATRTLRASRETKEIPILATTALFRSEDLKSCVDAGCNGFILKPFNGGDLQRKIRELLHPKELLA